MKKIAVLAVLVLAPGIVAAQTTLGTILGTIQGLITTATPIIVALALLFFFYGLAKYILNASDEEKKAEGRNVMIWGIIALFVMVSVWGLVSVIADTLGVDQGGTVTPPTVTIP